MLVGKEGKRGRRRIRTALGDNLDQRDKILGCRRDKLLF